MKTALSVTLVVTGMFASIVAQACGVEGMVQYSDGSKPDGSVLVTTSWDSGNYVYPRKGHYELDLGSSPCRRQVTIYADGKSYGKVTLPNSGNAEFNIRLR